MLDALFLLVLLQVGLPNGLALAHVALNIDQLAFAYQVFPYTKKCEALPL